jgi:two-component system, NtrC family, response regulator
VVGNNAERRREFSVLMPDAELLEAGDRAAALMLLQRRDPPVALIDLGLSPDPVVGSEGFAMIEAILAVAPFIKIPAITGAQRTDPAVLAIGAGAWDCLMQPVPADLLRGVVNRALAVASLEREHRRRAALGTGMPDLGMVGESQAIVAVRRQIGRVAPTDVSVIIGGESGTGKEVAARALHAGSPRRGRRFVPINCAAIPEPLLESELFGHERGAFTGAVKQSPGRIEHANGGTLFLDEIGDLPVGLQAKLLRFLQERTIERLGARQEIPIDVRVVCATHQDLQGLIRESRFREDLYFRLAEIVVHIPPLRDRKGDAALLAHAFLRRFADEQRRSSLRLGDDALSAIEQYAWPGNIRELLNVIKRASIMADGNRVTREDIGLPDAEADQAANDLAQFDLRTIRENAERSAVVSALARADGNIVKASELLGVSRPTLYDLMNRLQIKNER